MASHIACAACCNGDHANHDGRGTAPPGMMGGEACMCRGDCAEWAPRHRAREQAAIAILVDPIHRALRRGIETGGLQ
jgi:hypothetical protein